MNEYTNRKQDASMDSSHITTEQDELQHECSTCRKKFRRRRQLRQHSVIHLKTKRFQCDLCPFRCNWKCRLDFHRAQHTGIRPFKCPYCEKSYVTRDHLNTHFGWHLRNGPTECAFPGCKFKFETKIDMKHHALTHTETDKINDSGNQTIVRTGSPSQLTHNSETEAMLNSPYDQKLNTDPVRRDLVLDRDLKIIKCSLCEFSSRTIGIMLSHMKVHTNEAPHKCDVCCKGFSSGLVLE